MRAISDYELIEPNDKIAVCVSGGKDSFLMALCFQELVQHSKVPFSCFFLLMDPGYSKTDLDSIMENAKLLNIPLQVFSTHIFEIISKEKDNQCYLCAKMRRGALYQKASLLACNKIALAHHFNDVIETTMMAILYVILAVNVIVTNLPLFPHAIAMIFKSAFGIEQVAGGVAGWAVKDAMMNGIRRGLFSNEAGMGSAPNAAATAKSYPDHPAVQGFMQMLGVFIDTLVICTATAVIVILSGVTEHHTEAKGIQLMQMAMSHHVGGWGGLFVALAIFFFAFTSIIANYSYGESNIEFITGEKTSKWGILALRIALLAMVMVGAVADLPAIWNFADLSMGLMAMINLIAIVWLSPVAFRIIKDYERQVKSGKPLGEIKFDPDNFPKLKHEANRDAWTD